MPRRDLLQGDHDCANVVNCIVGVPGDGKDSVIVNPCGATQIQITPSVLVVPNPGWLQRIAVEVLHADQEPVLNQALPQFLDDTCHAPQRPVCRYVPCGGHERKCRCANQQWPHGATVEPPSPESPPKEDDCRSDPLLFAEGSALVDQMVAELGGFAGKAAQELRWQHRGLDVSRGVAPEVLGVKLSQRVRRTPPVRCPDLRVSSPASELVSSYHLTRTRVHLPVTPHDEVSKNCDEVPGSVGSGRLPHLE